MPLLWAETWEALAAVVFPTGCVACDTLIGPADPPLCAACWSRVPPIENACLCGAPLSGGASRCGRCRREESILTRGAALGFYDGPLRECIGALKYHGRHRAARGLATRLFQRAAARSVLDGADALAPVPLHPARERERGFNQASLLADGLAFAGGQPVVSWLKRIRRTGTQTALSAKSRRLNVRGAFVVEPRAPVRGAVVVLVDDVVTTGATLRECARVLLRAGAREVRALVVARAE